MLALARSRRAYEQHVVTARGGHFQCAFGQLLAADIGEIRPADAAARLKKPGVEGRGRKGRSTGEMGEYFRDMARGVRRQALSDGGLGGVVGRQEEAFDAEIPGLECGGKHAVGAAQLA